MTRNPCQSRPKTVTGLGVALALLISGDRIGQAAEAELRSCQRIWDTGAHNAFTDLVRFGDAFYCVFREGQGHVSPDGAVRVLSSAGGTTWQSVARLTSDRGDLRDPKIVVTPKGRLYLTAALARPSGQGEGTTHQTLAWFSRDGRDWDGPVEIGDPGVWLWRVTWHEGAAIGVGYGTSAGRFVRLYRSQDGRRYEALVPRLAVEGYPNETGLGFRPDGAAICLLRRDGQPSSGLVGLSRAPYTDWEWKDLGVKLGGPNLIRIPDGRWVAAVRLYDGGARTALAWLEPEAGRLTEFLRLPSGGDTSYPGLVWHAGELWVSYYSSHEEKTAIYLARVRLPAME